MIPPPTPTPLPANIAATVTQLRFIGDDGNASSANFAFIHFHYGFPSILLSIPCCPISFPMVNGVCPLPTLLEEIFYRINQDRNSPHLEESPPSHSPWQRSFSAPWQGGHAQVRRLCSSPSILSARPSWFQQSLQQEQMRQPMKPWSPPRSRPAQSSSRHNRCQGLDNPAPFSINQFSTIGPGSDTFVH
jgi:hypothetical protein